MRITLESVFSQSAALCEDLVNQVQTGRKLSTLVGYAVLSGAFYGATMGLSHSALQAGASAIKVPMLFLLTLAICLPSLHFLGLLFGATIRFQQTAGVLSAGLCRTSILLSAFAPISLFFLMSGSDYPFLLLMHVGVFTVCGAGGLVTIFQDFSQVRLQMAQAEQRSIPRSVLYAWMLLYMFVGTQMAFNLAPFVNRPGDAVALFNQGQGNFYSYLWDVIAEWMQR
ncbi:MAG: hypothetical protein FJ271_05125 [Planctomycetes bacterium]|nr:hypothetical protein [Planctomycetota bacterium]